MMRFFLSLQVLIIGLQVFFQTVLYAGENKIIDQSGQQVMVAEPFHRIISLYPAHTENLFSLGLDVEIIGVSRNEDYPPAALTKNPFSYRQDAERFLAVRPDLVLVRPMIERAYPDLISKLRQAGIVVVSLQPNSVQESFTYWRKLGILTGRHAEAELMVSSFQDGLEEISSIVASLPVSERKRVYFEAIHSKMKTFTPSSMAIYALQAAGGINVAIDAVQVRNTNIAAYGKERILSHAEEIDVFLAQKGAMNNVNREIIIREPGFQAIRAVKTGSVYLIDEKIISRPTLRVLEGIREIGKLLYPEKFGHGSLLQGKVVHEE